MTQKEFNSEQSKSIEDVNIRGESLPANPTGEKEIAIQLDLIKRYTKRPGVLKLPVQQIESAENSESLVIELDHPAEENPRLFFDKPQSWSKEDPLPKLLDWYGYRPNNYYSMRTDALLVTESDNERKALEHEGPNNWKVLPPEDYSIPIKESVSRKWTDLKHSNFYRLFSIGSIGVASMMMLFATQLGIASTAVITLALLWIDTMAWMLLDSLD